MNRQKIQLLTTVTDTMSQWSDTLIQRDLQYADSSKFCIAYGHRSDSHELLPARLESKPIELHSSPIF